MSSILSKKFICVLGTTILSSSVAYAAPLSKEQQEILLLKQQMQEMTHSMQMQITALRKELAHMNRKVAKEERAQKHTKYVSSTNDRGESQYTYSVPSHASVHGQTNTKVALGLNTHDPAAVQDTSSPQSRKWHRKSMVVEHLNRPPPDRGASFWSPDMPLIKTATVKDENIHIGGISVGFPGGRPTIASDDGRYSLSVGLAFHEDFGGFFHTSPRSGEQKGNFKSFDQNTRRVRIPFTFRYEDFAANVTPEYGGSVDGKVTLYEGNIQYGGLENTILTIGYFQPRATLEDSESSNEFQFMERPEITDIARNIAAGDARFSMGGITYGDQWYVGGYFTGHSFGSNSNDPTIVDNQTGGVLRVAGRPYMDKDWDIHLGVSASSAFHVAQNSKGRQYNVSARPELRLSSDSLVATGALSHVSQVWEAGPEVAVRWDRALFKAEYIDIGVNRDNKDQKQSGPNLNFKGYYVSGGYTIFGKPRVYDIRSAAFRAPGVEEEFNPAKNAWGALEAQVRWSVVDLNSKINSGGIQGGKQSIISAGLNWYLNRHFRVLLDYNHIMATRAPNVVVNRNGRSMDSIAMRLQAAF